MYLLFWKTVAIFKLVSLIDVLHGCMFLAEVTNLSYSFSMIAYCIFNDLLQFWVWQVS